MLTNAVASPILTMSYAGLGDVRDGDVKYGLKNDLKNTVQKVVIVNGSPEMLEAIETVLEAGHYDIVFVESNQHAYSQIKRVQPDLVILCVRIDDMDGFQVLSMLKLDESTRGIPVLTYTTEYEREESIDEEDEDSDSQMFAPRPVVPRMN